VWIGVGCDNEKYTFNFQKDGILEYTSATGIWRNGTWTQDGDLVIFYMNNGHSIYDDCIKSGTTMEGSAKNSAGHRWTFKDTRQ
jgi:hypothetical protein